MITNIQTKLKIKTLYLANWPVEDIATYLEIPVAEVRDLIEVFRGREN